MGKKPKLRGFAEVAELPPSARVLSHFYKSTMEDGLLSYALKGVGESEGLKEFGPIRHGRTAYAFAYVGGLDLGNVAILFPEKRADPLKLLLRYEQRISERSIDELLMRIVVRAQTNALSAGLNVLDGRLHAHKYPDD